MENEINGNVKERKRKTEAKTKIVYKRPEIIPNPDGVQIFELNLGIAKTVMFNWTFTNYDLIPRELRELRMDASTNALTRTGYSTQRKIEEINAGGKIDFSKMETQRPGILDSGKNTLQNGELCRGGIDLANQLIEENSWVITGAYFEKRLSEQDKLARKKRKKFRVSLLLSETGEEVRLSKATFAGFGRLLDYTWGFVNIWDNTMVNKGITINYGPPEFEKPYRLKIILKK